MARAQEPQHQRKMGFRNAMGNKEVETKVTQTQTVDKKAKEASCGGYDRVWEIFSSLL